MKPHETSQLNSARFPVLAGLTAQTSALLTRALLAVALLASTLAWAQSPDTLPADTRALAEFMPPGNVITFNGYRDAGVAKALHDELAGIDWKAGLTTLSQLLRVAQQHYDSEGNLESTITIIEDLADRSAELTTTHSPQNLLAMECPEFDSQLTAWQGRHQAISANLAPGGFTDFIAGIGFAPANPMPAATLLLRSDAATAHLMGTAVNAALECLRSDPDAQVVQRNQDQSQFFEISVISQEFGHNVDLHLVLAFENDTLILGTNPELVRTSLRLLNGSGEASLNGNPLWQARQRFETSHASFGYTIDLAEAATLLDAYGSMIATDDSEIALVNRVSAALKTLGGVTGNIAALDTGLLNESVLLVNPDAGDAALADLLLRSDLTVSTPQLLPADALLASSQVIDLKADVAYLQGWADSIMQALGEDQIDLLDALKSETGIDLNTALLDWIGNEVHVAQLDSVFRSPVDLLFGADTIIQIPITSESAARSGIKQLTDFVSQVNESSDSTGAGSELQDALEQMDAAVRSTSYRGVEITRLQFGPTVDIGIAVLSDTLLVGMPARSLQPVLDVQFDGGGDSQPYAFAAALSEPVRLISYDTGRDFRALVDLLSPLTQPAAFAARLALMSAESNSSEQQGYGWGWEEEVSAGLASSTVTAAQPGSYSGELVVSDGQQDDYGNAVPSFNYYSLAGVDSGDTVTATLDGDFDTFLYLLDADTARVLDANDDWDNDWNMSQLKFTATADQQLVLAVSSYWGDEGGSYTLDISAKPAAPAATPAELPSFADTLDLFELLPNAATIVGSHLGNLTGSQQRDGNTIYSRTMLDISW